MEVAGVKHWLPDRWIAMTGWAENGRIAVQIFIVLSGYCLMMPVARSGDLKGGPTGFIQRRARRILPPYYAALAFALLVISCVPRMNIPRGVRWDSTLPAASWGVLVSHLLLLQDLSGDWLFKINYPMWSIAQEWQIYFAFVFILLPLWRTLGILAAVGFSFVLSVLLRHIPGYNLIDAAPEFLFLFSVGMFAAKVTFAEPSRWIVRLRERTPWGWLTLVSWLVYAIFAVRSPPGAVDSFRCAVSVGGIMLCTLVFCTGSVQRRQHHNLLLRFCEWKPMVVLGTFSYSLYLVHAPILSMFTLPLLDRQVSALPAVLVQLCVAVPTATAFAYGFHLLFERPFMLGHPGNLKRAEKAAILDPAP